MMPIDYSKYPANWKSEIRPAILERANNCCEKCGAPNHTWIARHLKHPERYSYYDADKDRWINELGEEIHPEYLDRYEYDEIKVVLTIAHLDQNITNNDYDNLKALCQRCHLRHDRFDNARKAARTRRRKHVEQSGQLELWEGDNQL